MEHELIWTRGDGWTVSSWLGPHLIAVVNCNSYGDALRTFLALVGV